MANAFEDWMSKVRSWQGPNMDYLGLGNSFASMSKGLIQRLLNDTEAARYVSPFYMRRLQDYATLPFLQEMLLGSSEYGNIVETPGIDFLKNWIGMGGWGHVNTTAEGREGPSIQNRIQMLLNRLQQGASAPVGSPEYRLYEAWQGNPEILASILQLGAGYGPFGQWARDKIAQNLELAETLTPGEMGGEDWLGWLLNRYPVPHTYVYNGPYRGNPAVGG